MAGGASTGKPTQGVTAVTVAVVRGGKAEEINDLCPGLDPALWAFEMAVRGVAGDVRWEQAARPDSGTVQPQRDRLRDEADPPKVELVAWGEEKEGVRAGLGFEENTKDGKHVVGMGKPVRLVVKLRNSGKAVAEGSYTQSAYYERPPMVEDASGKPVPVAPPPSERGAWAIIKYTLKPGEERVLATPKVVFVSQRPVGEVSIPTVEATPGKYRIGFDGTGKVEVEVTK